jgi:hypothetical protein
MKKLLFIVMLFTACKPTKTVKKDNVSYIFNPNIWKVVELTKEDSLKLDSLIKLNH